MAYTPNSWNCGDMITAEKLNRLELAVAELSQGGGGGLEIINATVEDYNDNCIKYTLEKTAEEIYDLVYTKNIMIHIANGTTDTLLQLIGVETNGSPSGSDEISTRAARPVMILSALVVGNADISDATPLVFTTASWSGYPSFTYCESVVSQ